MASCNPALSSSLIPARRDAATSPLAKPCVTAGTRSGKSCLAKGTQLWEPPRTQFPNFGYFQFKESTYNTDKSNRVQLTRRQLRNTAISSAMDVPDFLPATWKKERTRPIGPSFDLTAEEATLRQLDALQMNDQPYPDHGVEVMYRFAGFDPFQRSKYFGPTFDLGQFERFRRIFHHSTYRVLLSHKERQILSGLFLDEHCYKQRVWVSGARPGEEEIFEFTLVQRVGGNWDGYWLTNSLHHDGQGITGGIAY